MTGENEIGTELGPGERSLAERLAEQRPVPAAGFRGALGRHLARLDPGYGPRPEHLHLVVAGYLGLGSVFLALGALSATGAL